MNQAFANILTHTWRIDWHPEPGTEHCLERPPEMRRFATCLGCSLVLSNAAIEDIMAGPTGFNAAAGTPPCAGASNGRPLEGAQAPHIRFSVDSQSLLRVTLHPADWRENNKVQPARVFAEVRHEKCPSEQKKMEVSNG